MKKISVIAIAFMLTGCAVVTGLKEAYAPKTSEYVASNATNTYDNFYKSNTVKFPGYNLRHFTNYKEITGRSNWLAPDTGIKPIALYNDKACNMYLYFDIKLDDWAFYSAAIDENGKALKFNSYDQKINTGNQYEGVSISEKFSISLPDNYLIENKGKNPQIEVQGKRDTFRIYLPDYYIDGMLQYFADNNINCK